MQGEWTLYYNDEPIKNKGEDLLNRHGFASKLAKMLVELDTLEGFCIGLYGSWGSGKTSLINMICDELATEPKMNVIRFNPWNVTSSDQLLRQFFALMIDHYIDSGDKYKKEIGDAIKQYANCLDLIPNVGPMLDL